ncbi:MAG: type II secretion system protein [Sedimentisphaeraceae bacterium JB056]
MKKRGFTLIELLVVISIIALLMAIMMPALSKVKESSRRTVCLSNCRQWNIAASTYAAANDDYYPARFGNIAGRKYDYSWPFQYYKVKSGGSDVYCDLIGSFLKPYLSGPEAFFCPSVPKNAPRHSVNGVSILGMGWTQIIEEVDSAPANQSYLDGDYSLFTGYNMTDNELIAITSGGVRFDEIIAVPPRNEVVDRDLNSRSPSPVKTSRSKPTKAISGDMCSLASLGDGKYNSNHPYQNAEIGEPEGMNASFVDGSSAWVPFQNFRPFMQYRTGVSFYWPDFE